MRLECDVLDEQISPAANADLLEALCQYSNAAARRHRRSRDTVGRITAIGPAGSMSES
jgi:hypothetical protein